MAAAAKPGPKAPHASMFQKGHARIGGRVKGKPNGITTDVKELILGALHAAPGGGQAWLEQQRDRNPVAFLSLLARIVPMQLNSDTRVEINIVSVGRELELIDGAFTALHRPMLNVTPAAVNGAETNSSSNVTEPDGHANGAPASTPNRGARSISLRRNMAATHGATASDFSG
jgi:hypothetical protein